MLMLMLINNIKDDEYYYLEIYKKFSLNLYILFTTYLHSNINLLEIIKKKPQMYNSEFKV